MHLLMPAFYHLVGWLAFSRYSPLPHRRAYIEHTSTRPVDSPQPVQWGDIGYLELGLKAFNLDQLYLNLKSKGVEFLLNPLQNSH
jgi:hypothetical protein